MLHEREAIAVGKAARRGNPEIRQEALDVKKDRVALLLVTTYDVWSAWFDTASALSRSEQQAVS